MSRRVVRLSIRYGSLLLLAACSVTERPVTTVQPVPPNARPALTWGDVMDLLLEEGFDDVAGLRQMRDGCWITDVYRVRMRTTVFVDRTGSLSFEFPPASCG